MDVVQTLLLGTTANVGMKLCGEVGRSQNVHLFRPGAFRRGAQDRFVIANQSSLGPVRKLIIWHDNTGSHPDWGLTRAAVRDLQMNVIYHFLANCTLTLRSSKMAIEKTIRVASEPKTYIFVAAMIEAVTTPLKFSLWMYSSF